jgi:hypothetical protein
MEDWYTLSAQAINLISNRRFLVVRNELPKFRENGMLIMKT